MIRLARAAHARHWRLSGDEGTGDRLAATITREWQSAVKAKFKDRFESELRIGRHLSERIDLVDLEAGVAYELKVSPNNDHFEFYRDIFKVMVARAQAVPGLRAFCFICPQQAARRYERGLRRAVLAEGERLGFKITVEAL